MKVSGFVALLSAEAALAGVIHEKRQFAGLLSALAAGDTAILGALGNGQYGRKSAGWGASAANTVTRSPLDIPNAKRVKVRTGPYLVPGMNRQNTYSKHWGMLESYYDTNVEKPCSGDCVILRQVGGLEYEDGKNANIDSGLWLHHMVHFNTGPRRWDPAAYGEFSCLPHEGVNTMGGYKLGMGSLSAKNTERYFVTGNERLPFHFYNPSLDKKDASGYQLDAQDKFFFLVELMNMNMKDSSVYITMTYDILDGKLPAGWSDVKTVFLDANACKSSEVASPKGKTKFEISSKAWRPNIEGRIVDSMGHLHDGGIDIDITTHGKPLCKAVATYAGSPEYVYREVAMEMHGDKVAKEHISAMPGCGSKNIAITHMKRDQSWITRGKYDYTQRAANLEAGSPSEVMAISIIIVAHPPGRLAPI